MELRLRFEEAPRSAREAEADVHRDDPDAVVVTIDFGISNEGLFFDHGSGATGVRTTTSLVCSAEGQERLQKLRGAPVGGWIVVTKADPDLDVVAACAVVSRSAAGSPRPLDGQLVRYIDALDSGCDLVEMPEQSLAMLFQVVKRACGTREETVRRGMQMLELLDREAIPAGFHVGWSDLTDLPCLQAAFGSELRRLSSGEDQVEARRCVSHGLKTLLSIPFQGEHEDVGGCRWVDGLFLEGRGPDDLPVGWKELARSEARLTSLGRGFEFLGVRHDRGAEAAHYVFSVARGEDADHQLSLRGLGDRLDACEWAHSGRQAAWDDGRGLGHASVTGPAAGSEVPAGEVLSTVLHRYGPMWRDRVAAADAMRWDVASRHGEPLLGEAWIRSHPVQWSADSVDRRPDAQDGEVAGFSLADVVTSLAHESERVAAYIPVDCSVGVAIPEEDPSFYAEWVVYLIAHRRPAISASVPSRETVKAWARKKVVSEIPGVWWTISPQRGLIMLDYTSREETVRAFRELKERYFSLEAHLVWTADLPEAIRDVNRAEAFDAFLKRSFLT